MEVAALTQANYSKEYGQALGTLSAWQKLKIKAITNKEKVKMNELINRSFEIVNR